MNMNFFERAKSSVITKIIFIGFLILVMLIPLAMVKNLIRERKERQESAISEVSQKWGKAQTINGPILVIPYNDHYLGDDKKWYKRILHAYFLPEKLEIQGKLDAEIRKRGIFKVPLYKLELNIKAIVSRPNFAQFKISQKDIFWEDAFVMIGIPDARGIKDRTTLSWKGSAGQLEKVLPFRPGPKDSTIFNSGIHAILEKNRIRTNKKNIFQFKLNLQGSSQLSFVPLGKENIIKLSSNWKDPSFFGNYLPSEHKITEKGFIANWKVAYFGRNFPQKWKGNYTNIKYYMNDSAFGIKLFMAVDIYQKATRAVKYAALFIFLTFMSVFLFEIINKLQIHPIQYLLVGFGLTLFYLLLLSLSEHSSFFVSYISASVAVVGMITVYCIKILQKKIRGLLMCVNLITLFGYLYILLINQDYALLIGSLGIFAILAFVMYITRNIDWYSIKRSINQSDS